MSDIAAEFKDENSEPPRALVQKIQSLLNDVYSERKSPLEVCRIIGEGRDGWRKAYEAILIAAKDLPKEKVWSMHEIESVVGQDPGMIGLPELLRLALKYYFDEKIPVEIRSGVASSFGQYIAHFGGDDEWSKVPLDFSKKEKFEESWKVMDFLADAYTHSTYIGPRGAETVRKYLLDAQKDEKGSYLLRIRARDLVAEMDGENSLISEKDPLPILLRPNVYGVAKSDAVYEVPPDKIDDYYSLKQVWEHVNHELRRLRGGDNRLFRDRQRIFSEAQALATRKVTAERLAFSVEPQAASRVEREYARLMHKSFRQYVEGDLGVALPGSLYEQYYLLNFLRSVTESQVQTVAEFSKRFGKEGLRTFLAASVDPQIGEQILRFGKEADPAAAASVFAAFGEMSDQIGAMQMYLEKTFGIQESAMIQKITETLLQRGRDLLAQANKHAQNPEKLRDLIQQRTAKGQLLLSVYRALKDRHVVKSLSELAAVRYVQLSGQEVLQNETELADLKALYGKNHPEGAVPGLLKRFEENLTIEGAELHRVTFENRLLAFMLITPHGEKRVHGSALNVDREFIGANVGPELLGRLLDMARAGTTVEIEALPRLAAQYEKQYGFVKTGEEVDPADGETVFKLELRPLS